MHFFFGDFKENVSPSCEVEKSETGTTFCWNLPTGDKFSVQFSNGHGGEEKIPHYHKGVREVYTVHKGWLCISIHHGNSEVQEIFLEPENDCVYAIKPGVVHTLTVNPRTVFTVQTFGESVRSLESGEDWHPADDTCIPHP